MEVSDALKMMAVIEGLDDGTTEAAERIERLNSVLLEDPEHFFDEFWNEMNPIREETKELFRSGKITPETTFGEAWKLPNKGGDDRK
jgi:archaellum component FlaC